MNNLNAIDDLDWMGRLSKIFNTEIVAPNIVAVKNKIKADTAQFLHMNSVIQALLSNSSVTITDKTNLQELWDQQQYLEGLLPSQVALANNITESTYSDDIVTDITNLGVFVGQMEYQISQVTELADKYNYNTSLPLFNYTTIAMITVIGVGAYLVFKR